MLADERVSFKISRPSCLLAIVNSVTEDEFFVKQKQIRIPSCKTIINYSPIEMIEDTVESVSMLPLSQETLVNNFVAEHEKSNNLCYIPCDKPVVIHYKTGEIFDA